MVEEFAPGIYTVSVPLKLGGAEFGTRMTIVRLGSGGLLLIAPVEIDDALAEEIARLGEVVGLIAPNAFHHFYFLSAAKRYPDAACFLAEGVEKKLGMRPAGAKDLSAAPDALWASDLEQVRIDGAPNVNEVVFFHRESKTLILTDLCFNFDPAPSGWTGFFLRLAGGHGKLAVSRLMRAMLKDRERVRDSIGRVLEWDFDGLVVTHGENLRTGARVRFVGATQDL